MKKVLKWVAAMIGGILGLQVVVVGAIYLISELRI